MLLLLKSLTASLFCSSGPSLHVPRQNPGGASAGGGAEAVWHDLEEQLSDNHQGNNGYVTVVSVFLLQKTMMKRMLMSFGDAVFTWARVQHLPPAIRQGFREMRFNFEPSPEPL